MITALAFLPVTLAVCEQAFLMQRLPGRPTLQ